MSEEVPLAADHKLKRIALLAAFIAASLLIAVGACFSIRAQKSQGRQVERMKLDVSRALNDILYASEDVSVRVDAVDSLATKWRGVFKEWKNIPFRLENDILTLQNLQDKKIRAWREILGSADSFQVRRQKVREAVLTEQSNWPDPPGPRVVVTLTDGVRDFGNGAIEGALWPLFVWRQGWNLYQGVHKGQFGAVNTLPALRVVLFSHTAPELTFGLILGFAVLISVCGYLFCYFGMRINSGLFSLFGLLYFLYAVIWAVFVMFLFFDLIQ